MQRRNKKIPKKQNKVITLFDDILDEDNSFNNIKTDDIYVEDDLFDNNDSQDIKNISSDVIETIDLSDEIEIPFDDETATDALKKQIYFQHTQVGHV